MAVTVAPAGPVGPAASLTGNSRDTFPQTCLREDRASLLEQDGLDEEAAMANEFRHGMVSLAVDALPGAARFAAKGGQARPRRLTQGTLATSARGHSAPPPGWHPADQHVPTDSVLRCGTIERMFDTWRMPGR
ncbi:hypothetical protein [Blastococcus sp. SYSU DS1024]